MGSATRQYSKEEIIEKYQRHIDNYENIIVELEIFENSVYVKEKNIKIYLLKIKRINKKKICPL